MPRMYPKSFRDRAVRMVDNAEDSPMRYTVIRETAAELSIATETLRRWVAQAEIDSGDEPGVTSGAQEEIRRLKRENAELRRANEVLKTASLDSNRQCNMRVLESKQWARLVVRV